MIKTIKELNKFREACKKYSDKKISKDEMEVIKESIYWSPSSHGWEPYRVLIIDRENPLREKLFEPMLNQGIVKEADKLLIFISIDSKYYSTYTKWVEERVTRKAKLIEKNYDEIKDDIQNSLHMKAHSIMMDIDNTNAWAEKQAYIGMSFAMYSAGLLKIDSTPMEGMDRLKVKDVLKNEQLINDDEHVAVALSLGYRFDEKSFAHWGSKDRVRDPMDVKFKEI